VNVYVIDDIIHMHTWVDGN